MAVPATQLTSDERELERLWFGEYAQDPTLFAREVLNVQWWSAQQRMAEMVRDYPRVAVKKCHASGGTKAAADIAIWFLWTHQPAIVVTTAPTMHQVTDLLWGEINATYQRANVVVGECLTTRIKIAPDWYAVGLSTRESHQFQGFHSPNMLVIVDEASGVRKEIFEAIEGIISTASEDVERAGLGMVRLLIMGQPLAPVGELFDAFDKPSRGYATMTVSAFSTPNFTGEKIPRQVAAQLISKRWAEERAAAWGEASPLYQARVLGEFPSGTDRDVVLPLVWAQAAVEREAEEGNFIQLGVDVARLGSNRTALAWRSGDVLLGVEAYSQRRMTEVAGIVQAKARELRAENPAKRIMVVIDEGGVGGGALDVCMENGQQDGVEYHGIHFGAKANDAQRFTMRRDEMYWGIRERAEKSILGWAVTGDAGDRCMNQLAQIHHTMDGRGRTKVESKDDMAKRGMASPDEADAAALAFAQVKDAGPLVPPDLVIPPHIEWSG